MPVSYDMTWGFLSMLSWGVADYLGRHFSVRIGSFRAAFYVQALGIAPPVLYFLAQVISVGIDDDLDWGLLITLGPFLGVLWALSYLSYYRGFEVGMVSVVAGVASAWLVVSVLTATLFLGEIMTFHQVLLIGGITGGVLLIAQRNNSRIGKATGFWYGMGSMVTIGVGAAFVKPLSVAVGPILAVLFSKFVGVVLLWLTSRVRNLDLSWPTGNGTGLLVVTAFLDSSGFLFYAIGVGSGPVSLIAPLAAAHPIVTMLLAWFLIRERPSRLQKTGIIITVAGVIALSAIAG